MKRQNRNTAKARPADVLQMRVAELESQLDQIQASFKRVEQDQRQAQAHAVRAEEEQKELLVLNRRLAKANAEAANLTAELEEKNQTLWDTNVQLARANAHAAELMAMVEVKEEEIQKLNRSISRANVQAAELVAERELQMEQLRRLNALYKNEIEERKKAEEERIKVIDDLQLALSNIKTLKGLIPVCAWCKKIRDDKGYWGRLESYLEEHSGAQVSHGICPECDAKMAEEDPEK